MRSSEILQVCRDENRLHDFAYYDLAIWNVYAWYVNDGVSVGNFQAGISSLVNYAQWSIVTM